MTVRRCCVIAGLSVMAELCLLPIPGTAATAQDDMHSSSVHLSRAVQQLQTLLDVEGMENDLGMAPLTPEQARALQELLKEFRGHWFREGTASIPLSHVGLESLLESAESLSPVQRDKLGRFLLQRRITAEVAVKEIERTAALLGGAAETMAEGVSVWAELFGEDMDEWSRDFEGDWSEQWERWAEGQAEQWEAWQADHGKQWEAWARNWAEQSDSNPAGVDGLLDGWEQWAEQLSGDSEGLERWAEDYEQAWDKWGKDYERRWEEWGKSFEEQVESGQGFPWQGLVENLQGLQEMPLDKLPLSLESLPLFRAPPGMQLPGMKDTSISELLERSVGGSLDGLQGLEGLPLNEEQLQSFIENYARGIQTATDNYRSAMEKLHDRMNEDSDRKWQRFGESFDRGIRGRVLDPAQLKRRILKRVGTHRGRSPEDVARDILENRALSGREVERLVGEIAQEISDERATIEARERELEDLRREVEALRREIELAGQQAEGTEED